MNIIEKFKVEKRSILYNNDIKFFEINLNKNNNLYFFKYKIKRQRNKSVPKKNKNLKIINDINKLDNSEYPDSKNCYIYKQLSRFGYPPMLYNRQDICILSHTMRTARLKCELYRWINPNQKVLCLYLHVHTSISISNCI